MSDTAITTQEGEEELKAKVMAERIDLHGEPVVKPKEEGDTSPKDDEVIPPVDDKSKEDGTTDKEEGNADWAKEWVKLDNPDADAAIELMKTAGVSPVEGNAIFAKALESGKLEDVDWTLLEAKVGPATARLVRNGIEKYHAEEASVQMATYEKAMEIVGGNDNWAKIQKWSKELEKSDKTWAGKLLNYRKAIDVGGETAEFAITAIKAAYEAAPGNSGLGVTKVLTGDTTAKAAATGAPLGRAEYVKLMQEAERTGGRNYDATVASLRARRAAGRQAGI